MSSPRSSSPASSLPNMPAWKLSPASSMPLTPRASPLRRALHHAIPAASSLPSSPMTNTYPTPKTHIVITNPDGSVFEGDFTYSRPGTRTHSPYPNPHDANTLPAADFASSLAAALTVTSQAGMNVSSGNLSGSVPVITVVAQDRNNTEEDTDPNGETLAGLLSTALRPTTDQPTHQPLPFIHSVDDNNNDNAPLLPLSIQDVKPPAQPTPSLFRRAISPVTATASYIYRNPGSSVLAVAASAPTALNALTAHPADIGAKWWNEMSTLNQAHAITNGISSLTINTVMNAQFMPEAVKKASEVKHTFRSSADFIDNTLAIILAIGGAFVSAVIAYNAFLWLPLGVALAFVPAALSFIITLAQRYDGIKSIFRRIRNWFDKDVKTQLELVRDLKHIHPAHKEKIEAEFNTAKNDLLKKHKDISQPFTHEEYEQLMSDMAFILSNQNISTINALITETSSLEWMLDNAAFCFDVLFALLVIAPPALLTFADKGYQGVNLIANLITHANLPNMNILLKCLIAADPGIASALLYANSALNFRAILLDTLYHLYQYPKMIPFGLLLLAMNVFASESMLNVALGVVNNPDNLTGLKPDTPISIADSRGMQVGALVVNLGSSSKKACPFPLPAARDVTIKQVADYFSQPNEHRICNKTGVSVRSSRFFQQKTLEAKQRAETEIHTAQTAPTMTFV